MKKLGLVLLIVALALMWTGYLWASWLSITLYIVVATIDLRLKFDGKETISRLFWGLFPGWVDFAILLLLTANTLGVIMVVPMTHILAVNLWFQGVVWGHLSWQDHD